MHTELLDIYYFQGLDDLLFYGIHEMGVYHEIKNNNI